MDQDQDSTTAQIWASAVHAVTVQKRSLSYAANRYGVDCHALKRRVSTSYASKANSSLKVPDTFRLTGAQEKGVLTRLLSCSRHSTLGEGPSCAIREAVLAVAGNGGVHIPMGFPSNRWIANFKRSRSFPVLEKHESKSMTRKVTYPSPPSYSVESPVLDQRHDKFALENQSRQFTSLARREGVAIPSLRLAAPEIYLPFEDETGVLRVVRAHADVGVLMEFQDLVRLLHRTSKKTRSWLTSEQLDSLVNSFVSRTHLSIGHFVSNWPDRSKRLSVD